MKVSVLIITYNHEAFISQTLDSVLMQKTNFDYEILISEDCSTDATRDIILQYQKRYPEKIKLLLSEKNQNDNEVVVRGILAAQGQYIAMSDGDDYWTTPDKLQKQVDFLDSHPGCTICFHAVKVFYEDQSREPWISGSPKEILTLEDLLAANFIQTCSVMFRRGLFEAFPDWYHASQIGDWELHIFNAQHGDIGYIDEVMGAYRKHSGGVYTSSNRLSRLKTRIEMYKNINAHLNFKYDGTIKMLVSKCCYELALEYIKIDEPANARKYLKKCIAARPLNRYIPKRNLLGLWIRLHAPFVYRAIQAFRKLVS